MHDFGRGVGGLERLQRLLRVGVELILEVLPGQAVPRGRLVLLVRVGPGVAVVEVQRELHAGCLDALRERDGRGRPAEPFAGIAARRLGIYEQAQTDRVETVRGHDLQRVVLHAVQVVVATAPRFVGGNFRHVAADAEEVRRGCLFLYLGLDGGGDRNRARRSSRSGEGCGVLLRFLKVGDGRSRGKQDEVEDHEREREDDDKTKKSHDADLSLVRAGGEEGA